MKLKLPNRSSILIASILIGTVIPLRAQTCNDTFDDGTIDPSIWQIGGARRGYSGYGAGNWQWSITEIPALDGYLQLHVSGPTSANTYGGEAWVRTKCNYNDGNDHMINFRWGSSVNASHIDAFAVEVTNGEVDTTTGNCGWFFAESPANKNLYLTVTDLGVTSPCANQNGMHNVAQATWSMRIDATTRTATLYDGPNLSGSQLCQKTLDPSQPWYVRFIIMDATSAGFPAGDNSFRLYDYYSGPVVPSFVSGPTNTVAGLGSCATLEVDTVGAQPISYQWFFDGTPIFGASSNALTLCGLQPEQAGLYCIVASNLFGTVTNCAVLSLLDIKKYAGLWIYGPVGRSYQIQATPSLSPPTWSTIATVTNNLGQYFWVDMDSPIHQQRFYRATPQP